MGVSQYCVNCGEGLSATDSYCSKCGSQVVTATENATERIQFCFDHPLSDSIEIILQMRSMEDLFTTSQAFNFTTRRTFGFLEGDSPYETEGRPDQLSKFGLNDYGRSVVLAAFFLFELAYPTDGSSGDKLSSSMGLDTTDNDPRILGPLFDSRNLASLRFLIGQWQRSIQLDCWCEYVPSAQPENHRTLTSAPDLSQGIHMLWDTCPGRLPKTASRRSQRPSVSLPSRYLADAALL